MNRKIKLALIFLLILLGALLGLQFLYNQNLYKFETKVLQREVNEALQEAIAISVRQKHEKMLKSLEVFLENPQEFEVKTRWNETENKIQFSLNEVNPIVKGHKGLTMSFEDLQETPESIKGREREVFIQRFLKTVEADLEKNYLWYYTPKVGELLHRVQDSEEVTLEQVTQNLHQVLNKRNLPTTFALNAKDKKGIVTKNYYVDKSYKNKQAVYAVFPNPMWYILSQQIASIVGSLVLVIIVVFSFIYLMRLLLTQEKLNEEREHLIALISHELRTPVASISLTAEALKNFQQSPKERIGYLNIILSKTKELETLISDILNEITLKKQTFVGEKVNIQELLSEMKFDFKDKDLLVDVSENELYAVGDKRLLGSALRNLIENGYKYNSSTQPQVCIKAYKKGGHLIINVEDNGIGIEARYRNKIFEKFFRIHPEKSDIYNTQGFGIGLSYVKQVLDLHRARIEVLQRPEGGTIFKIFFPNEEN